jgi:chemotaxis protein methyltransferase CheR
MKDRECIEFLQWALPKLEMRWPGFRKVRRQVCRRVKRRIAGLSLSDSSAYSSYLDTHPEEWSELDSMCRITISRFYRDRGIFGMVEDLLCELGKAAEELGEKTIHCWSAGCASGEEPYTLLLIWELRLKSRFPELELRITASDSDPNMIRRAKAGCYGWDSMKDLPEDLLEAGFDRSGEQLYIKDSLKRKVTFLNQDIRKTMPEGPFQFILCRNLVFTYYNEALQRKILERLAERLVLDGLLVTGLHETLPVGSNDLFMPEAAQRGIYRRRLQS